ncbi:MAG: Holliday junction branch migration DNA helicase RuvB [Chloroflexota bacterium]|nr:Holliday junction branch migration DNA helicase RuvB [Dehalococcoidia bacterium]MDW8254359.1 Holliday junction branch migration DNA helicase RuvB [Chloroflexota bacterium]
MAREKVVKRGTPPNEDAPTPLSLAEEPAIKSLRPRRLAEYIGQTHVVANLRVALQAAKQRGEPLDHVLLHGPPGLGKTTLSHIIAAEMETTMIATSGPMLEKPKDLLGILTNLETGQVLFIDEIHRIPHVVEEFLYAAMEDFQVDFVLDRGAFARTIKIPIKPFTLVGATTRAGLLTAPLRDRFGIFLHLDFYTPEELAEVVSRSADILGIPIEPEGAAEIARRSRGTPRIANRLLRRVRDYAQVHGEGVITREIAQLALEREGIDERGLDALDRRYLWTISELYAGGPVGIEALAATLNEEPDTLEEVVEPYLLKQGYVIRTASGRKTPSSRPDQPPLFSLD